MQLILLIKNNPLYPLEIKTLPLFKGSWRGYTEEKAKSFSYLIKT